MIGNILSLFLGVVIGIAIFSLYTMLIIYLNKRKELKRLNTIKWVTLGKIPTKGHAGVFLFFKFSEIPEGGIKIKTSEELANGIRFTPYHERWYECATSDICIYQPISFGGADYILLEASNDIVGDRLKEIISYEHIFKEDVK